MDVITVKLDRMGFLTHWPCFGCGGTTDKSPIEARIFDDDKATRVVICERCLGDPDLAGTIRLTAKRWRVGAELREEFAADLPVLPTQADWRAANDAADDAWAHDAMAAEAAPAGDCRVSPGHR